MRLHFYITPVAEHLLVLLDRACKQATRRVSMAGRSHTFLFLVFSLILLVTFSTVAEGYSTTKLSPSDCKPKCTYRCSATSHKKPCMFFCQKCCAKCLCVPPGTYGNKQVCPCYNNWKTQQGGPKCP